ncbi:hypothetical protein [Dyadobacter arcticus]|uniref:Uncharacterized protein n=1 Tax=Dyadobacter arcticus TaxID=1078754 RepID=A0ABX0US59_9BACT|nr:hypothetical protein [Dyadobacter arcticus]NIJ55792.1 hypothetical protein [Dyadobacter arcticus]
MTALGIAREKKALGYAGREVSGKTLIGISFNTNTAFESPFRTPERQNECIF